jgi:hypothetical protein
MVGHAMSYAKGMRPKRLNSVQRLNNKVIRKSEEMIKRRMNPCAPVFEDVKFLLGRLPSDQKARNQTLNSYRSIWLEAMDGEPLEHRKQNKGRHAANTWLRLNTDGKRYNNR